MIDLDTVLTVVGADEVVQQLSGLIDDGYISYFKLGEGGWNASAFYTEQLGDSVGGQLIYALSTSIRPVIPSSFSIVNGTDTITDDGSGALVGNGSGTIDYKSGNVSVTFDTDVAGGSDLLATYKYRGELSELKEFEIGEGDGATANFCSVLPFNTFGVPISESTITVIDSQLPAPQSLTDDGSGNMTGDGTGTIDYVTGEISINFTAVVPDAHKVIATYKYRGAPKAPSTAKTDLESEADPDLYTFTKVFTSDDRQLIGAGTGKVSYRVFLDLFEGIDNGAGGTPYFFEGGLFSAGDVLVCYFTFTKIQKTGSGIIDLSIVSVD